MNIAIYLLIGWLTGEILHLTIYEFIKHKFQLNNKKVISIIIFITIAVAILIVCSGFYRVQSYETAVVTTWAGEKQIQETTGIKYNLLSSIEIIDLRVISMEFPQDYAGFGKLILSNDNKPIQVWSSMDYKVSNVKSWALKNKNSERKLRNYLESAIAKEFQKTNYNEIKSNKQKLQENIFNKLKEIESLYGVEISRFNLIDVSDTLEVKSAKSNAEAQKIHSEAKIESFKSEAEALRQKYNSISDKEFIKYMELISAIKEGEVETIIIPEDMKGVVSLG